MLVLTILTGIAVILLLLVLGWALQQIAVTLESIQRNLENIAMGVRAIDKETGLLVPGVDGLNQTLSSVAGGAKAIGTQLTQVEQKLRKMAGT